MADNKIQEEARLRYPKVIGRIIATGDLNDYRREAFIAGAEWQAERLLKGSPMPEDTVIFQKGIEEGKRLMMEDAVEGVVYRYESYQRIATAIIVNISRELLGNKVKIVIVKEDKK